MNLTATHDANADAAVRYLRCRGGGIAPHGRQAATLLVRIASQSGQRIFDGYILLTAADEVIEKSSHSGCTRARRTASRIRTTLNASLHRAPSSPPHGASRT